MKFKIFRYNKNTKESKYEVFEVPLKPGLTILDALFYIQDHLDDSISFRHSCRGAVCGTCAMLINKVPRLACRTQVTQLLDGSNDIDLSPYPAIEVKEPWEKNKEVIIEPLPHMPVIKDLVVNMDEFFQKYIDINPKFVIKEPAPLYEQVMDAKNAHDIEKYVNCILCGACYAACPINDENIKYFGPAALAKLYRFYIDGREPDHESRILTGDSLSGWWGCKFHTNCAKVCPKGVTPNTAIGKVRLALTSSGQSQPKKENFK
jgi:succinate dehydrogenase / fumarate reductase iron-sulfur subunit